MCILLPRPSGFSTRQQDLIKSNSEADDLKEEPFGIGECMKSEANTSFWKVPVCLGCFVASWKSTEFEG
jgi:hypothetical protein